MEKTHPADFFKNNLYPKIKDYSMCEFARLENLYLLALKAQEIPLGNFVDCGVAAGGSSALLASAVKMSCSSGWRRVYCFDTFQGLPSPGQFDTRLGRKAEDLGWGKGTCKGSVVELVSAATAVDAGHLVIPVKGLFADTLPFWKHRTSPISLLHMDGDWYDSTWDVLQNLYESVVLGGFIQIDDYGYWEGCKKAVDEFFSDKKISPKLHVIDGVGVWMQKTKEEPLRGNLGTRIYNLVGNFLGNNTASAEKNILSPEEDFDRVTRDFLLNLVQDYQTARPNQKGVDSMTTPKELAFVRCYAERLFSGRGKIIDLGCWFGATSLNLACGLDANPKALPQDLVEAYDLFEWDAWMDSIAQKLKLEESFTPGDCFLEVVEKRLGTVKNRVRLHKIDLMNYVLPPNWTIEFLFVDAMKNWELAAAISKQFFPKMIPKGSLVVQQDFAFHDPIVCTNHLIMWHLRDYFEFLHHVPNSCSVVFRTVKTPEQDELPFYDPDFFSEEDIESAYDYSINCVSPDFHCSLLVAKLCHHLSYRQDNAAERTFERLRNYKIPSYFYTTIRSAITTGMKKSHTPNWDELSLEMMLSLPKG